MSKPASAGAHAARVTRRALLGQRRVMVVVGDPTPAAKIVPLVRHLLAGGADLFELRLKRSDGETRAAVARAALAECARAGALLLIDDDAALARDTGADGAHVGQADDSPARARQLLGEGGLLGLSVHGADEARAALRDRAALDYVGVGTVFRSGTKPGLSPCGLTGLRQAIEQLDGLWSYAIGGIDPPRAGSCVQAGAHGVAVGAAITGAADPAGAWRAFRAAVARALADRSDAEGWTAVSFPPSGAGCATLCGDHR